ncbi:MAG: glycosyltransferase family 1 protein, partial [Ignavibacteriaceae bacterium]
VSKSAREDILTYYDVVPDKVHYVYLWADEKYKPIHFDKGEKESLLKKLNLPEKFILFVGAIEERKNIRGILRISDILYSKGIDIKFVLVGKESFGFDPLYSEINKRKNRIIYYKYIDEETLPLLYNLSIIFLFPSYYEGFGLPPLEAMKCGAPVLASNNSSLKEVVGEGGILHEADNLDSFVQSIIALLHDDDFYNKMKSKAIQQAKNFSAELQMPKLIDIFNKFNINY